MAKEDLQIVLDKAAAIQSLYQTRFASSEAYRNKIWRILCRSFFSKYISKTAEIIDLGSGWGEFINNIEVKKKYAMDLNHASKAHLSPDVVFIHQDCSATWPFESDTFDVVFTSNFIEHLFDKPSIERSVAEAYRCLKNNGLLICMGPNIKYVRESYWDFWDHHIPLTEVSCSELLRSANFIIERKTAKFLPYSMSKGFQPPIALVKIYLRTPIIWKLFGKQFLVIGKKIAIPD